MYSSSNSFLGGTNSARPGQNPLGQQSTLQQPYSGFPGPQGQQPQQPQQQPQQQPGPFAPQPTGFGGGGLQPQLTGFPPPQQQQPQPTGFQQPQYTGYPPQSQPQQQQQHVPPVPPIPAQHQQQQPQPQPQPPQPQPRQQLPPPQQQSQLSAPSASHLHPQQTSSQIAQSFQSSGSGTQQQQPQQQSSHSKIPNIRLSFITAQDQAKFEQLFKSAVGDGQALDGEKAKDLLLRSKLPGSDLSHIWVLSDTTKSGQLLFPEFAVAMYLCNLKLTNKDLPSVLPERIANEVSSMVDIISFGVPDDRPPSAPRTNVPNFDAPLMQNSSAPPAPQQPQPQQPSNSQLLSQLTTQPTGFYNQATGFQPSSGLQPQATGFPPQNQTQNQNLAPQPTGFPGNNQGMQSQQTGYMTNPQATGYSGPRPPMPPMPTGYGSNLSPSQTGATSLTSQPTGVPGQWGFVNAPATGLPNIETLQQRLMPQAGREGGFTTAGLAGNATIPWAVTKDEKKIYDQLFKAWDGLGKGFIGGDVAIEIMGQSGLAQQDLERIWTLSDPNNRGRLNMDEFAVAMHLIYRKLNGYPVPNRLPPELVPPSTRNLNDSIGTVKSLLSQDAESRKSSGAFLQPQKTGVSYLKNHSFRDGSTSPGLGRKDATVFKNNDDAVGYKSSARRRVNAGGRTPSPKTSPTPEKDTDDLSSEQLKKKIHETKIMLDAVDFKDQDQAEQADALDRRDRREVESLMDRIRRVQDDIDTDPKAAFRHSDSGAEKRALRRQLQSFQDQIPEIASNARKVERSIADAKLELFRLKDAKAHPDSSANIVGTGPGGAITEGDRIKARARARMQARAAELAGRPPPPAAEDDGSAARRLEEETSNVKVERERNESMTRDVEESVNEFSRSIEDSLKDGDENSSREHERRRWEDALGVEDQIRDFIYDLQRSSRTAKVRKEEQAAPTRNEQPPRYGSPASNGGVESKPSPPPPSASPSSAAGMSHQDRVASAKERAQKRIAERMAAAGLKPSADAGETLLQRQEREKKEREERLRRAEEEDAKREQERQQRIASEQGTSTSAPAEAKAPAQPPVKPSGKKPPPAPPSRKGGGDNAAQTEAKRAEEARAKAEMEAKEQAIREEQESQEAESQRLEAEAQQQEEDLAQEKEAAQARLKALEEQVRQGKIKKQEEKRRKQAAEREAKEKEAKLAAQRAEIETARERERQLQLQIESLGDEDTSSDEEGPVDITPQHSTPTQSQIFGQAPAASPPPPPPAPPAAAPPVPVIAEPQEPEPQSETKLEPEPELESPSSSRAAPVEQQSNNPYFRNLNQQVDGQSPSEAPPAPPVPETVVSPPEVQSTNPFHRLTQQQGSAKSAFSAPAPTGERKSRARPEEDDWSGGESDDNSSDDDERPGGGSAKQLASILFGTMGPPRPLSATDDTKSSTPVQESPVAPPPPPPQPAPEQPAPSPAETNGGEDAFPSAPDAPPPPPPPMPGAAAPPPPPPPPPPMPSGDAPDGPPPPPPPPGPAPGAGGGGPPPGRGALLADIQAGRGLKKVQTKDRSASAVAGRVLD